MMSFNLNQVALLLIVLVIGWLLGLIMSGRGKYRRLWHDEQVVHRSAIKDRDARIEAANTRIADLERQSATAAPIGAGAAMAARGAAHDRDDLSKISGISQAQEVSLNDAGYHRYSQIAALDAEQEVTLETRLGLRPGTIAQEEWRKQAHDLDTGHKRGLFG